MVLIAPSGQVAQAPAPPDVVPTVCTPPEFWNRQLAECLVSAVKCLGTECISEPPVVRAIERRIGVRTRSN